MVFKGLSKTPVFAKNAAEFASWLVRCDLSRKNYKLCNQPIDLAGMQFLEVVVLDGAHKRQNWQALIRRVLALNPTVHVLRPSGGLPVAFFEAEMQTALACSRHQTLKPQQINEDLDKTG